MSNKVSKTSKLSNLKASKFEIKQHKSQYINTGVFIESIPFIFESTVIVIML